MTMLELVRYAGRFTAADEERRRLERDLHDGAQQRLVALRIRAAVAADTVDRIPDVAELLRDLGREVEAIIDEVRALARGIYPSVLSDRGLEGALRTAARHAARPARVRVLGVRRYAAPIERAVYFACLEAMQNAAKHAGDRTTLVVELRDDGALRFEVRDDGAGFDVDGRAAGGAGLANMTDRIAAVGGRLEIRSDRGRGTRVTGHVPLCDVTPDRSGSTARPAPRVAGAARAVAAGAVT